jgi:hypothetical protein
MTNTYTFTIAADIRAYGTVGITGDNPTDALAKLTPEYVAEHFEPNGSSDDLDWQNLENIAALEHCLDQNENSHLTPHTELPGGKIPGHTTKIVVSIIDSRHGVEVKMHHSSEDAYARIQKYIEGRIEAKSLDRSVVPDFSPGDWSEALEYVSDGEDWAAIKEFDTSLVLPSNAVDALKAASGAILSLQHEIEQMQDSFDDADGSTESAMHEAENAIAAISTVLKD